MPFSKILLRTSAALSLAILLSGCIIAPAPGPYYYHPHHYYYGY